MLFQPCYNSIWSIRIHCPQIIMLLRKNGIKGARLLNLRKLGSSRYSNGVVQIRVGLEPADCQAQQTLTCIPKHQCRTCNLFGAQWCSQLRQNYLKKHFQAKVGKQLPKQFPETFSFRKLDVGNFAFSDTANTPQARNYLRHFQRGSKSVIYYLINC